MTLYNSTTAEQISNGLPKGRRIKSNEYKACCPAHPDNSPSLSISQKSDTVLVKCWSGCSQSEVIDALKSLSLWPDKKARPQQRSFTSDEREYMALWFLTYRDNTAKGHNPSPEEKRKYSRYHRALSEIANG